MIRKTLVYIVASTRINTKASVALLAVGLIGWGGGIRFTIGPLDTDIWSSELPAPVKETVWQPGFGTVPRQSATS